MRTLTHHAISFFALLSMVAAAAAQPRMGREGDWLLVESGRYAARVEASNLDEVGAAVMATGNTVTLKDGMLESNASGSYRALRVP